MDLVFDPSRVSPCLRLMGVSIGPRFFNHGQGRRFLASTAIGKVMNCANVVNYTNVFCMYVCHRRSILNTGQIDSPITSRIHYHAASNYNNRSFLYLFLRMYPQKFNRPFALDSTGPMSISRSPAQDSLWPLSSRGPRPECICSNDLGIELLL